MPSDLDKSPRNCNHSSERNLYIPGDRSCSKLRIYPTLNPGIQAIIDYITQIFMYILK